MGNTDVRRSADWKSPATGIKHRIGGELFVRDRPDTGARKTQLDPTRKPSVTQCPVIEA
jgi:hypothetical protein